MAIKKIVILHSNDIHGDFLAETQEGLSEAQIGGLSLLSGYVNHVRKEEQNVLFVISGDMLQGSMIDTEYKGISTMEIMNYLSPDVVTLGNHEFDYGLPHLLFLEKLANFPIVNANLYIKGFGKRLMKPYHIVNMDGMEILFTGIITESVIDSLKQDNLVGSFVTLEDAAKEIEDIARAYKHTDIDLTVVLSHIGFESDKELAELLSPKAGVDLVIGGHSHTKLTQAVSVNNILIAQAGHGTNNIGRFELWVDDETNSVVSHKWELVELTSATVSPDEKLAAFIDTFKENVDKKYNAILTTFTSIATHPNRTFESSLGNIYSDAFAEIGGVDMCFIGSGSIRVQELGPTVTLYNFLDSFPYDDSLQKFTLTGANILKIFERFMRNENRSGEGECYQVSKGVEAQFDTHSNKLYRVTFKGKSIDPESLYSVAFQGYHVSSCEKFLGLTFDELTQFAPVKVITASAQELLKEYLRAHQRLCPSVEGRLRYLPET